MGMANQAKASRLSRELRSFLDKGEGIALKTRGHRMAQGKTTLRNTIFS